MPTPHTDSTLVSSRPDLAGSMEEFSLAMNRERMIAHRVLSPINVVEQAGQFGKLPIEELTKLAQTGRASGSDYNRGDFKFESDTYSTEENGFEVAVDQRNARIYGDWFSAEMVSAAIARNTVMINYEKRVADLVFDESTYSPANAGAATWATVASATPILDVEARVQSLYTKGVMANALICSWKVFRDLRNTASVIDRITASGAGNPAKPEEVTIEMLKQVFDLEYILVGGAQIQSADEGQTSSLAPVWSNNTVAVTRIAPEGAPITELCLGRTFHYTEDGSSMGSTFESYQENRNRSEIVRYRHDTDEKIIHGTAIELISIDSTS